MADLQLLVNHYQEDEKIVKRFLDSVSVQKGVEFEVLLCSDGGVKLSSEFLSQYGFPIQYAYAPHSGVCHTRNILMDRATAEYIMFCDVDDMFFMPNGLKVLLNAAKENNADIVGSPYQVERKDDGKTSYYVLDKDTIRVHGKIFRRQYLVDNNIRYPDEMETSGDMMFMYLAYALTDKDIWIKDNFYIWKNNPNSVTRHRPFYSVWAYPRTLKCYTLLADELKRRGKDKILRNAVATTIGMICADSLSPYWNSAPKEDLDVAELAIREYLSKYYDYYKTINEDLRLDMFLYMCNYKHVKADANDFKRIGEWADRALGRNHGGVLIIGYGTVGHNLEKELAALKPVIYDKYKNRDDRVSGHRYSVAFICVDTPKADSSLCDISEVRNAILENDADVFVIKSAILPGSTDALCAETGKHVVLSPEYYGGTQHCNNYSFDYTILGGNKDDCTAVIQLLQKVYDGRHSFRITDAKTAELAKYMENCYLAMKVSFCNQFFDLAEQIGVDYEELRELFILDPRVDESHTFVYRDKPYWDSHCLNKDVPAIAETYQAPLLMNMVAFNESRKHA